MSLTRVVLLNGCTGIALAIATGLMGVNMLLLAYGCGGFAMSVLYELHEGSQRLLPCRGA